MKLSSVLGNAATILLIRPLTAVATSEALQDGELPKGVTICDGSDPVGYVQALLLQSPLPYCMNGGACKPHWNRHESPCHCPDGFAGPHCEFSESKMPTECSMECFSGGTCQVGAKSFELLLSRRMSPESLQYCLCPENTLGAYCEREEEKCGAKSCMHGGTCVRLGEGANQEHCDCVGAVTGTARYAGKFCEKKASVFCSDEADHNGHQFCVNGGKCKGGSHLGCECPSGFMGPICEFEEQDIEYSECTLECYNGGICRKGAKDVSFLQKFNGLHRHLLEERYNEDFEHCVCPRGFVGMKCEYEMEICPGREYVCMHGGECTIVVENKDAEGGSTAAADGKPSNTSATAAHPTPIQVANPAASLSIQCNCQNAQSGHNRFMGKYCEAKSSEFCTIDGGKTRDGLGYDSYCTHGGKCMDHIDQIDGHPGCECMPGYFGDNCEMGTAAPTPKNRRGLILGMSAAAVALMAVLIVIFACRMRRRARKRSGNARFFNAATRPPRTRWGSPTPPSSAFAGHARHSKRGGKRRSDSSVGYSDNAAPAPTLDHIHSLEPWMKSRVMGAASAPTVNLNAAKPDDDHDSVSSLAPSESPSKIASEIAARNDLTNQMARHGSRSSHRGGHSGKHSISTSSINSYDAGDGVRRNDSDETTVVSNAGATGSLSSDHSITTRGTTTASNLLDGVLRDDSDEDSGCESDFHDEFSLEKIDL